MTINRSTIPDKSATDPAGLDDINDAYQAINNLKASAADLIEGIPEFGQGATTAGDRGLKWILDASHSVRVLWDNTAGLFKLLSEAGGLEKLAIADGTDPTHAATVGQLSLAVPAGVIFEFAGATLPDAYLWANGATVSRTTYAALFSAIDTTFGVGDGSTTFRLPDRQECFAMGRSGMGGASDPGRVSSASTGGTNATTLGGRGGEETNTLTEAQMPPHSHDIDANQIGDGGSSRYTFEALGAGPITFPSRDTGDGDPHNTMPPWLALNFIIKT
jgi:microcystin-dependent protein